MDQNALLITSSNYLARKKKGYNQISKAFLNSLYKLVKKKYDMPLIASIDKLDLIVEDSLKYKKHISEIINHDNLIVRVLLKYSQRIYLS